MNKYYAKVQWSPHDVLALDNCPPNWGLKEAEEFLVNNESNIENQLVEAGHEVIGTLLEYEKD